MLMFATKEVTKLKKKENLALMAAKTVASFALRRDANSTTCLAIYQPKVPTKLHLFKERKNAGKTC